MSFIYVGRLDELKGINVLFEAWKMMGDEAPKLTVCGTGLLEEWCRDYIKEHGLIHIEMKGKVNNADIKKLMAESEALIIPSLWYEGFPMTIVEAYSVGCPVIGSDIGNVGNLIEDGITGCKFEPGNAVRLKEILSNYKRMSPEKIVDIYTSKYTVDYNYLKLQEIYEVVN